MRIKKVVLMGGVISVLGIVIAGGLLGGDGTREQAEEENTQREQVLLVKESAFKVDEASSTEQDYVTEVEEDSNERIEELVAEEQMKYEYQEGIMGRIYFSDTGETAKIMTGISKEDVVSWCEKMVSLDPEYLRYEIL